MPIFIKRWKKGDGELFYLGYRLLRPLWRNRTGVASKGCPLFQAWSPAGLPVHNIFHKRSFFEINVIFRKKCLTLFSCCYSKFINIFNFELQPAVSASGSGEAMEHSLQTKTLIIGSRTTGADLFRDLAVRELLGIPRENEVIDSGVSVDIHGLCCTRCERIPLAAAIRCVDPGKMSPHADAVNELFPSGFKNASTKPMKQYG
jgi:hypothetical protein